MLRQTREEEKHLPHMVRVHMGHGQVVEILDSARYMLFHPAFPRMVSALLASAARVKVEFGGLRLIRGRVEEFEHGTLLASGARNDM
jgi:hypothetical protein